jgi:hypothetical protein
MCVNTSKAPATKSTRGSKSTQSKKSNKKAFLSAFVAVYDLLHKPFKKPNVNSGEFAKVGGTMFKLQAGKRQPYSSQKLGQRNLSKKELQQFLGHMGVTPFDLLQDFIPESALVDYQKSLFDVTR